MKIHRIKSSIQFLACVSLMLLFGCSESWLDTKPLSFYAPESVFKDISGLEAQLKPCMRQLQYEFFGDKPANNSEMIQSDICVDGTNLTHVGEKNMDVVFMPSFNQLNHESWTKIGWYWTNTYVAIKYANTVVSRIDDVKWESAEQRNHILGSAFFHRSYWYFKAVHQFGDLPFLDEEVSTPKTDYYSTDRWSILERLYNDMEFAYKWVYQDVERASPGKSACGVLLMKICMSLEKFDRAIEIGKELTAKHPLMTQRFTANQTKPRTNLMHDLHSIEAKSDMSNTEGIFYVASNLDVLGSDRSQIMRNAVPFWNQRRTPDGLNGTSVDVSKIAEDVAADPEMDLNRTYGRGIGRTRPTNYYQYDIWGAKERNDLRAVFNRDSWRRTEDMKYNDPALKAAGNIWYGQNIQRSAIAIPNDTVSGFFQFPFYKLFVRESPSITIEWRGGETPWYVYRSAEVYLMLGECYYWKDQPAQAAEMLNVVRSRAGADPLTASDINIGAILDERARELYYEELRHSEIVRIAYTYAKSGKRCEVLNRTYSLTNFAGPGGVNSNVKEYGINFWWDWVMTKNNFYRVRLQTPNTIFQISVHHVLWPIPEEAVVSNTRGVTNQNIGYPGAENNVAPLIAAPVSPQTQGY